MRIGEGGGPAPGGRAGGAARARGAPPPPPTITLVRHGDPDWAPGGGAVGGRSRPHALRPAPGRGRRERARAHARRALYVSPYRRSRETAEPIAKAAGREARWWRGWRRSACAVAGLTQEDVDRSSRRRRGARCAITGPGWPGAESFARLPRARHGRARARARPPRHPAFREQEFTVWSAPEPAPSIVIVAHGGTNAVLLTHLLDVRPVPWEWLRFESQLAAYSVAEARPIGEKGLGLVAPELQRGGPPARGGAAVARRMPDAYGRQRSSLRCSSRVPGRGTPSSSSTRAWSRLATATRSRWCASSRAGGRSASRSGSPASMRPRRGSRGAGARARRSRSACSARRCASTRSRPTAMDAPWERSYADDVCVACELLREGHVWVFRRYTDDRVLLGLEAEARAAGRGLWSLPEKERIPPWDWRDARPRREARPAADLVPEADASSFRCDGKRLCRELRSCARRASSWSIAVSRGSTGTATGRPARFSAGAAPDRADARAGVEWAVGREGSHEDALLASHSPDGDARRCLRPRGAPTLDPASERSLPAGEWSASRTAMAATPGWACPLPSRRSAICAGARRARPRAGKGVREALATGEACPQYASVYAGSPRGETGVIGSEDCLTLDVWAPRLEPAAARSARLPVMVWIHGGGHSIGRAGFYQGGNLAETQDVVVVAVQYRLGPLGWLRHAALRRARDPDRRLGQLRHARPDPRARLGARQRRGASAAIRATSRSSASRRAAPTCSRCCSRRRRRPLPPRDPPERRLRPRGARGRGELPRRRRARSSRTARASCWRSCS